MIRLHAKIDIKLPALEFNLHQGNWLVVIPDVKVSSEYWYPRVYTTNDLYLD